MIVHLVDGTYELFRTHFGAPGATAPDGREVGAVRGLLRSFAAWIRDTPDLHAAVAFDTRIESFRNELYAGYKSSEGVPAELLTQFPLAERAAEALGLTVWRMVEFEADDALATGAAQLYDRGEVEQIRLCTPDKDLAQCVRGARVVRFDRGAGTALDEASVVHKYGVLPASIPDWLGLVGDAADGIPGIERWGEKSAATVLSRWGTIAAIPDDPAAWEVKVRGAEALAKALRAGRTEAALWRRLATLRTDVPLDASPGLLRWRGVDPDALAALVTELGGPKLPPLRAR